MLNVGSNRTGLASQAAALKQQLEATCRPAGTRAGETVQLPHELQRELLATLDSLVDELSRCEVDQSARCDTSTTQPRADSITCELPPTARLTPSSLVDLDDRLNETVACAIDRTLAAWQAQLTCAFEQSATRELQQRLESVQQLAGQLQSQQELLEQQRETCERELRGAFELRSRLARQRKVLAGSIRKERQELDELRVQAAQAQRLEQDSELQRLQTEVARLQQELADAHCQRTEAESSLANQTREQADGNRQRDQHESELQAEIELLTRELVVKDKELESKHLQLVSQSREIDTIRCELEAAREQLASTQAAVSDTASGLSHSNDELNRLKSELERSREAEEQAAAQQERVARELAAAREEIELLESTLVEATQRQTDEFEATAVQAECDADNNELVEQLEQQLRDQHVELLDLRNQNSDLAAQIAKLQMGAPPAGSRRTTIDQESMTWEERKALIMQQLDDDGADFRPEARAERIEIEEVLRTSQREIERRDREIADLQTLVEQQAGARDGVAIGAAGIAQLLDSDELIAQERQKLKDIQREWEDKLRQAEIDLSMERAKLARERIQLETQLEQIKAAAEAPPETPTVKGQPRTRKWLEHLGLRENKGE